MLSCIIQCEKYDFKGWLCSLDPTMYMSDPSKAIKFVSEEKAEEIIKRFRIGLGDPDEKITIVSRNF